MAETKNRLGGDIKIKGIIKFRTELVIDGKVEGGIFSQGSLTVSENGEVVGDVKTGSVTIAGKVHGNVTALERCELKARGELLGDLKTPRLVIEDGAVFIGASEVTGGIPQADLARAQEAKRAGAA